MPRRATIAGSAAGILVLAGTTVALLSARGPDSIFTAAGSWSLRWGDYVRAEGDSACGPTAKNPELRPGTTVTVRDQAGAVVGAGPIQPGRASATKPGHYGTCVLGFRIPNVRTGSAFYTVTPGTGPTLTVTAEALLTGSLSFQIRRFPRR
ncbi:hypothetical protein [Amycolatopsis minnesotensis]|uniref:Uncharacterized protein n=1 Tax=Amycolatopsis minnesotensis TaxID=337894 RepID=A0ABN2S040_9PSEU